MNRRFGLISGLFVCAAVLPLAGCDDDGGMSFASIGSSSDAKWEKVCAKPYFYNFLDTRGQNGTVYCGEWRNRCVGKDGKPSDGCA
jgi:hypothetical protein